MFHLIEARPTIFSMLADCLVLLNNGRQQKLCVACERILYIRFRTKAAYNETEVQMKLSEMEWQHFGKLRSTRQHAAETLITHIIIIIINGIAIHQRH